MKKLISTAFLALTVASLGACASSDLEALRTISNSPVGVGVTHNMVGNALRTSLVSRAWVIESETDDSLIASITSDGGKAATIKVVYSAESFSIERLATERFDYNDKHGLIAPRYNRWITNIEHDVMVRTGVKPEEANAHVYRARAETVQETKKILSRK